MATATARSLGGLLHDLNDEELLALTASDNRPGLKEWLAERIKRMWHAVSYDQSRGLIPLINDALGPNNVGNFNTDITPERFPLKGTGVRQVKCRVEVCLNGETSEQAAKRLTDAGHVLANTGDLVGFLHDHLEEVEKWSGWVLAISEDSRWTYSDGFVLVPFANVNGARRYFLLHDFRGQLSSRYGVLVLGDE